MVVHMKHLDSTFTALADPTRRAIVARLTTGRASVSELAAPFAMSQQAISKHIAVLRGAGLVRQTRDGRIQWCELDMAHMTEAGAWIHEMKGLWKGRFARLEDHLKKKHKKRTTNG